MVKIIKQFFNKILYEGAYDLEQSPLVKEVQINKNFVSFNLSDLVNQTNQIVSIFSIKELKEISKLFEVKITFYPNGNIRLNRLDSSECELKDCYFVWDIQERIIACVAFGELFKNIYRCELIGALDQRISPR
jgi:hypothetical protein